MTRSEYARKRPVWSRVRGKRSCCQRRPGVPAFERLKAFVDATIKVEAQRIQHTVA
jgi:hypothetical protein